MSTVDTAPAPAAVTPTVRGFFRRASFWIKAGAISIIGVILVFLLTGRGVFDDTPLSIGSAAPAGSMAVAEVLRQQGVTVTQANTLPEAETAATQDSTILFYDPSAYLSSDQLSTLSELGNHLVIVEPDFFELEELVPGIAAAGVPKRWINPSTLQPCRGTASEYISVSDRRTA
jgi:hypothetical protein